MNETDYCHYRIQSHCLIDWHAAILPLNISPPLQAHITATRAEGEQILLQRVRDAIDARIEHEAH